MFKRAKLPIMILVFVTLTFTMLFAFKNLLNMPDFDSLLNKNRLMDRDEMEVNMIYGGYNFVYILNESDFQSLKNDLEAGKNAVNSFEKYDPVTELDVGTRYYAVGYSISKTTNGSKVDFITGAFHFTDAKDEELPAWGISELTGEVLDFKGVCVNNEYLEPTINLTVDYEGKTGDTYFPIDARTESEISEAEICAYVGFIPQSDMRIKVSYYMKATSTAGYSYANSSVITADSYFDKKVDLVDMTVSYLEGKDYEDGRYDETNLKDSLDVKSSETYYMVIKGTLKPRFSQNAGESVSLRLTLPPDSEAFSTVESANSGKYTEEEGKYKQKVVNFDFRLPETKGEEKAFMLIIKYVPEDNMGNHVRFAFFSSDGISVVGKNKTFYEYFGKASVDVNK